MLQQHQIFSINPIALQVPDRVVDLEIRITAPVHGNNLPVILLSHGGGTTNFLSSGLGLSPLADYWAAHGFIVIQPTHLSSKSLHLGPETAGYPIFAKERVDDMKQILDQLDDIENSVPLLKGRINKNDIAAAGHSGGAFTASMLVGGYYTNDSGNEVYIPDSRVKAVVLLAASGEGDDDMPAPWGKVDIVRTFRYNRMLAPALVVTGDKDISPISSRGASYYTDAYFRSPGEKSLLTIFNGEHMLGGVTGYDSIETTDENPERVAFINKLTVAYLKSVFDRESSDWSDLTGELIADINPLGKVESKFS